MKSRGFTLIEILIYVGILGIVSVLFISILATSVRIQSHEIALGEVGNQANFVLQTIQRLVRESSAVEEAATGDNDDTVLTELSYIKLRLSDPALDPTCISLVESSGSGIIVLSEGPGSEAENCKDVDPTDPANVLTTNKVAVPLSPPGLVFTRLNNEPAKNLVEIGLTLDHASSKPESQLSKTFRTAVGRVSAATFDSDLIPETGNSHDIGLSGTRWLNLFVNNLDISGTVKQESNYDAGSRGYFIVGSRTGGGTCNNICIEHGAQCSTQQFAGYAPIADPDGGLNIQVIQCNTAITNSGALCFCD